MTAKHVEAIKEIVFGSNNVVNDLVVWYEGEIKRLVLEAKIEGMESVPELKVNLIAYQEAKEELEQLKRIK